jgi:hypothetical protein
MMENTYRPNNATYYSHPNLKPLYMLIKVEVDSEYINNQQVADEYAEDFGVDNECVIVDTYYPDDEQFPYIAK